MAVEPSMKRTVSSVCGHHPQQVLNGNHARIGQLLQRLSPPKRVFAYFGDRVRYVYGGQRLAVHKGALAYLPKGTAPAIFTVQALYTLQRRILRYGLRLKAN